MGREWDGMGLHSLDRVSIGSSVPTQASAALFKSQW